LAGHDDHLILVRVDTGHLLRNDTLIFNDIYRHLVHKAQ
jgi:hypothetical protein